MFAGGFIVLGFLFFLNLVYFEREREEGGEEVGEERKSQADSALSAQSPPLST